MPVKKKRPRLVLLDSHAIIHRAYHALPDFSSAQGEPTGALYGLVSMLLKITQDLKPEYIIAARDLPGPTHRHDLFEDYKGTRAKTEDELVAQLERAPEVFKAFGIPVYEAPGFEADDVIGTIVKQLRGAGVDVVIASGDLDTLQLVSDKKVQVYTLRKGLNDTIMYDEDAVKERFGFGPEMVVDYKALRGDPSDNIVGIKGIGEKTATDLITQFGSIKDIYRALEKNPADFVQRGIKPRIIELLRGGKASAEFSRTLAAIHMDAPVKFVLPEQTWSLAAHFEHIATLCDVLEFRSLKERVRSLISGSEHTKEVAQTAHTAEPPHDILREASIALWLLHSDTTNPTLADILNYANTEDFEQARAMIFAELQKTGKLQSVFDTIEKPLIPVVEHMNATGIFVDAKQLAGLAREYNAELGKLAGKIFKHAGREFNINSPKQLATVLFDELKIGLGKQKKTPGGARTTREDELAKMAPLHPIIANILSYRELQKLLSTYVEKMPALLKADGRLHAEFLQAGTTTGRMGCQNPNLQNIPVKTESGRRIRVAFAGAKGFVLAALDYSQIELRIAAALSGDTKLVKVFKEGGDVHTAVAAEVFDVPADKVDYEMRRRAKVINFGILYGMGVNALRTNLGEKVTREEAAGFLEKYFKDFSGLARYIEDTKVQATKNGFTETMFGRRRYFPALKSPLPNMRAQAERMAINAPIQGTQSDIIKRAMVEADQVIEKEGWREKARLVLQVHDELVYEVVESDAEHIARRLRDVMESIVSAKEMSGVPIIAEASVGQNWGEMERLERSRG